MKDAAASSCDACAKAPAEPVRVIIEENHQRTWPRRGRRHRYELVSSGFDDLQQGGSPGFPDNIGLRVPLFRPAQPYLFQLLTWDGSIGDAIVGCRMGVKIGAQASIIEEEFTLWGATGPFQAYLQEVTTPGWLLPDASWTFSLTCVPLPGSSRITTGPLDQEGFIRGDGGSPCLLYNTATISTLGTGFPGYLGLTAYTPPAKKGSLLWRYKGIPWPWSRTNGTSGLRAFQYRCDRPTRFYLYCEVEQGDPGRTIVKLPGSFQTSTFSSEAFCPEDLFLNLIPGALPYAVRAGLTVETTR